MVKVSSETAQGLGRRYRSCCQNEPLPLRGLFLPENVQPFSASPIYSRTNGHLKKWYVDIRARVTQGQLLAVIETHEVDQQLQQLLSNLNTAKANLALERSVYLLERLEGMEVYDVCPVSLTGR